MQDAADRPCRELAYGDVKRVELAIALASEPRLLLMDEPTAGMAPRERNEADRPGEKACGRARRFGAVYRAFDGCRVCICRPDRGDGARPADRRRRRQDDPRRIRWCAQVYFGSGRTFERAGSRPVNAGPGARGRAPQRLVRRRAGALRHQLHHRPRRGGRADGKKRRRQIDDHEGRHGADRAAQRNGPRQRPRCLRRSGRSRSPASASALCRRIAASSPT